MVKFISFLSGWTGGLLCPMWGFGRHRYRKSGIRVRSLDRCRPDIQIPRKLHCHLHFRRVGTLSQLVRSCESPNLSKKPGWVRILSYGATQAGASVWPRVFAHTWDPTWAPQQGVAYAAAGWSVLSMVLSSIRRASASPLPTPTLPETRDCES